MIIDSLINYIKYNTLHPLFKNAFDYLVASDSTTFSEGKFDILSTDLFAIQSTPITSQPDSLLEAHQAYIDIHYVVEGTELFGWKAISDCNQPIGAFNHEKDYIQFDDKNFSSIELNRNTFAVVYPEDAHAPGIKISGLKKIVLKIKV
jgi:biofilm protein TabA